MRVPEALAEHGFSSVRCYVSNFSNYNSTCGVMQLLTQLGEQPVSGAVRITENGVSLLEFKFSTSSEVLEQVVFVVA